jgi:hypothetical protein
MACRVIFFEGVCVKTHNQEPAAPDAQAARRHPLAAGKKSVDSDAACSVCLEPADAACRLPNCGHACLPRLHSGVAELQGFGGNTKRFNYILVTLTTCPTSALPQLAARLCSDDQRKQARRRPGQGSQRAARRQLSSAVCRGADEDDHAPAEGSQPHSRALFARAFFQTQSRRAQGSADGLWALVWWDAPYNEFYLHQKLTHKSGDEYVDPCGNGLTLRADLVFDHERAPPLPAPVADNFLLFVPQPGSSPAARDLAFAELLLAAHAGTSGRAAAAEAAARHAQSPAPAFLAAARLARIMIVAQQGAPCPYQKACARTVAGLHSLGAALPPMTFVSAYASAVVAAAAATLAPGQAADVAATLPGPAVPAAVAASVVAAAARHAAAIPQVAAAATAMTGGDASTGGHTAPAHSGPQPARGRGAGRRPAAFRGRGAGRHSDASRGRSAGRRQPGSAGRRPAASRGRGADC